MLHIHRHKGSKGWRKFYQWAAKSVYSITALINTLQFLIHIRHLTWIWAFWVALDGINNYTEALRQYQWWNVQLKKYRALQTMMFTNMKNSPRKSAFEKKHWNVFIWPFPNTAAYFCTRWHHQIRFPKLDKQHSRCTLHPPVLSLIIWDLPTQEKENLEHFFFLPFLFGRAGWETTFFFFCRLDLYCCRGSHSQATLTAQWWKSIAISGVHCYSKDLSRKQCRLFYRNCGYSWQLAWILPQIHRTHTNSKFFLKW